MSSFSSSSKTRWDNVELYIPRWVFRRCIADHMKYRFCRLKLTCIALSIAAECIIAMESLSALNIDVEWATDCITYEGQQRGMFAVVDSSVEGGLRVAFTGGRLG